ncbi:hypothetical protein ABFS82_14G108800 [Erythranthe guttata]|uniref:uncharacterized protein LOC105952001 n=1 Tax=Erythranthe guttata TaxID=4155 RepID=UPI00064DD14D|nr:PREDICTED: uncharacterized protein LOC105952001 [Erythranthe guttata]|eukprot:XP_012830952.1 PREDICTED: uncharacterized protein LOC105952001 [Erythranthe guttata]
MAYFLNIINKDQENQSLYNNPRISFSSDFGVFPQLENTYREAPVSSDFEFSAPDYNSMSISADEIFSNGKMLPLSTRNSNCPKVGTTLRDELLIDDEYKGVASSKGIRRWKNMLGLKRKQGIEKSIINGNLGRIDEMKISEMV